MDNLERIPVRVKYIGAVLEHHAQAEFDLAIRKGQRGGDFAEIAIGKIAVGLTEMRRVGGVVRLQAQFGFDLLGDCEIFEQRQIYIGKAGAQQDIAARGTRAREDSAVGESDGRRQREGGSVDVVRNVARIYAG